MSFKVGDKVRLLKVPDRWNDTWGTVGAVATVLAISGDDMRVDFDGDKFGWYWNKDDVELVEDTHTPESLGMALELAKELERDWNRIKTVSMEDAWANGKVADWLRSEVTATLYSGDLS